MALPQTMDDARAEIRQIDQMTNEQIIARYAEWSAERGYIFEHEDDEALVSPERYAIAFFAFYRYTDEMRAIRVDAMRVAGDARGEFALAMGLGILPQEDLS